MKTTKRSKLLFLWIGLNVFLALPGVKIQGAACCGGGGASGSVALLAGDQSSMFSLKISELLPKVSYVDSNGYWHKADSTRARTSNLNLALSFLVSDLWQMGFSVPLTKRVSSKGQSFESLGDFKTHLAFEVLPEYSYNPYKPRIFIFSQLNFPTGPSVMESRVGGTDVSGSGFYGFGLGLTALKSWQNWFTSVSWAETRLQPKSVRMLNKDIKLVPKPQEFSSFLLGYKIKDISFSGALSYFFDQGIKGEGDSQLAKGLEKYTSFALTVEKSLVGDQSLKFSYIDQSLFGRPVNTSLSYGFELTYVRSVMK